MKNVQKLVLVPIEKWKQIGDNSPMKEVSVETAPLMNPQVHRKVISQLKVNNQEGSGKIDGRSQNTVPIASTQVAIKGIIQYSKRAQFLVEQLATRHSREHTLRAVGPDVQVE